MNSDSKRNKKPKQVQAPPSPSDYEDPDAFKIEMAETSLRLLEDEARNGSKEALESLRAFAELVSRRVREAEVEEMRRHRGGTS